MDKLKAMRAFTRIVETGSFTRAAESLGVPRSQVTRLVQSLEKDLKTLLLHRTTRWVALTAEGTLYFHFAVRILDDIKSLESRLSGTMGEPMGRRLRHVASATGPDMRRVLAQRVPPPAGRPR